jgi:uronate dehydrogenase
MQSGSHAQALLSTGMPLTFISSSTHMRRILITGAAGAIGTTLRAGLAGAYPLIRLSDVRSVTGARSGEEFIPADLTDLAAVERAMQGIDCVVHLGGVPREDAWEPILQSNIVGTYNVFEAARKHGVQRVVYASSNHVIGFYRAGRAVGTDEPVRPDSRYGVSKAFGEALARLYVDKYAMSLACLRIGSFRERPQSARQLATWVSPRDLTQLVRRCIDAPKYGFLVLYGVSNNTRSRWKNPHAALVGYAPQDNAEDYAAEFGDATTGNGSPEAAFHGGEFCGMEFANDVTAVD